MDVTERVKLMDSGTAQFEAPDFEAAVRKVSELMLRGGGTLRREGKRLVLDFSTRRYWQVLEATVEATSVPGRFAVSLREGDAGRLLRFDLPSHAARERNYQVLNGLALK